MQQASLVCNTAAAFFFLPFPSLFFFHVTSNPPPVQPTKALSVGLRLLASRRATVAAAAAAAGVGAGAGDGAGVAVGSPAATSSSGRGKQRQGASRDGGLDRQVQETDRVELAHGDEEREKRQAQEEEEAEEAARDAFFGVDALREAFGSALKGPGPG